MCGKIKKGDVRMKKIYVMIFVFLSIISFNTVNANTIYSIKMDIYVDNAGDAHVTEVWDCYAYEDTEWYHTYNNIGKSHILNLAVKDENKGLESMADAIKQIIS